MNLVVHVITEAFPPTRSERHLHGGLERSTCDLVDHLCRTGVTVIVYTCGLPYGSADVSEHPCEVVDIADQRGPWERALLASASASTSTSTSTSERISNELVSLNFLLLRNAIRNRQRKYTTKAHCIVSNFALTSGYLSTLISAELHIPHVAAIVGSDFSRGSRNAIERAKLQEVCSRAACVVCKSQEQSKGLQIIVPELQARVIPTPNNYPVSRQRSAGSDGSIEVFADCGLSYHKGTAVLLDSLLALRSEGLDIKLTLCGSISDIEESYWQRTLVDMKCVAKSSFLYLGYIERPAIHSYLERSHIYCSATLGEGSSAARIAALCSGIPMVTTSCGEFANEVGHMSHIRVVQPGDAAGFRAQLRDLCRMAMQHGIAIDWDGVARCRDEFSPERTWRAWTEMLASIAARDQGLSSISASEIP